MHFPTFVYIASLEGEREKETLLLFFFGGGGIFVIFQKIRSSYFYDSYMTQYTHTNPDFIIRYEG